MKLLKYLVRLTALIFLSLFINANSFAAPTFSVRYDINADEPVPDALRFNNDGTKMYVSGRFANLIHEYRLTSAFDISDVNFASSFDPGFEEPAPSGITFNADGSKLYVVGVATEPVYQYEFCLLYTSPSPRDVEESRMPSSA